MSTLTLKLAIKDIKHHFKSRDGKWPLNYPVYESLLPVRERGKFAKALHTAGFDIKYDEGKQFLAIIPKTNRKKATKRQK